MKTFTELFASDTLKPYWEKASQLTALNDAWRLLVRTQWSNQCTVANLEAGILTLTVPNSAWATQIYYAAPEILKELREYVEFKLVKKIRCRVVYETAN